MSFLLLCKDFRFWGWGGEDDDLFYRVKTKTLNITLISPNLGRFKVITTNRNLSKESTDMEIVV